MNSSLDDFVSFVSPEGTILHAGCGVGDVTQEIAGRGFEVVGIDIDPEKIGQALSKTDRYIFRQMDARSLQYPSASFDGVWANNLLEHMPVEDVHRAIDGFARVLKQDAPLYFSVKEKARESGMASFTLTDVDSLKDYGLKIVSRREDPRAEHERITDRRVEIIALRVEEPALQAERQFEDNCFLCPDMRFSLNRQVDLPGSGALLWGDHNLYLMPDIAPIVEGHLLLVTTKHYMCYGACPPEMNREIVAAQQFVRELFETVYQMPTIFMEHGPAQPKRAGVCIEHAHWHCLPATASIDDAVKKYLSTGQEASLETLQQMFQAGQSYIYIEEAPGKGRAYLTDVMPSQFLRQLTVSLLNRTDWEWQTSFKRPSTQELFRRTLNRLIPEIDVRT